MLIGDGAAWIWNLAAAAFPEATHIVDLFHACEHLHSLIHSPQFMLLDGKGEWLGVGPEDLDYGDTGGIEAAVRRERPVERLSLSAGRFNLHASRTKSSLTKDGRVSRVSQNGPADTRPPRREPRLCAVTSEKRRLWHHQNLLI
jgi:hypothetical protein